MTESARETIEKTLLREIGPDSPFSDAFVSVLSRAVLAALRSAGYTVEREPDPVVSQAFADNVNRFLSEGYPVEDAISRAQITPSSYFEVDDD